MTDERHDDPGHEDPTPPEVPAAVEPVDATDDPVEAPDAAARAPEGIDATTAEGRRRLRRALAPRATRRQAVIAVLFVVLGFALVAAVRGISSSGLLATAREDEVVRVLDDLNERQARLTVEQQALAAARDRLSSGTEEQRLAVARARADALAILAGTAPATGPGIRLTLEGTPSQVGADVLLQTVQELRDAGAEALQVGSVRVVAGTWFDDDPDGRGVVVSGTRLAPPYRFVVIGDASTLATALEIPGGVSDTVRTAGGRVAVAQLPSVLVSALQPLSTPQYARPAPSPSGS